MTKEEFLAALRQALMLIAGSLVSAGYMTQGKAEILIGVVIAASSFAWMIFSKKAEKKEVEKRVEQALFTPVPGGK